MKQSYVALHKRREGNLRAFKQLKGDLAIAREMNMATAKKTTADAFDMAAFSPDAFKQGYEKLAESMTAAADFHKESLNALMASAGAFAKGFEKLTTEHASFSKTAYEDVVATAKAAASSKTLQEAVELNSDFVRTTVEKNLGQINKVADIWASTAKETVEPLTARYSDLVEKIQSYRP